MAFGRATGVPGTHTPTPVRATGSTEQLSSHRADDERLGDGFERDVSRGTDWRAQAPRRRKRTVR
jgi:hypothetical protein